MYIALVIPLAASWFGIGYSIAFARWHLLEGPAKIAEVFFHLTGESFLDAMHSGKKEKNLKRKFFADCTKRGWFAYL